MSHLDLLTQINLDDLTASFGWKNLPAQFLRRVFFFAARKFAKQMLDYDSAVGQTGLSESSRRAVGLYAQAVRVFDSHLIPAGGFLALSNHPGMTDTLALFSALRRNDLKIIALDRPFLKALPNISERLFYVREDSASRIALIRRVSAHLKNGGAALTFPAGKIEPDPEVYEGAEEALNGWTDSAGVFLRMSPETPILPVVVRNVIWKKAARHPLVKLKKTKEEREKLAAAFQLLSMIVFNKKPTAVTVQIGKPITTRELGATGAQEIHQAVLKEMRKLIKTRPAPLTADTPSPRPT